MFHFSFSQSMCEKSLIIMQAHYVLPFIRRLNAWAVWVKQFGAMFCVLRKGKHICECPESLLCSVFLTKCPCYHLVLTLLYAFTQRFSWSALVSFCLHFSVLLHRRIVVGIVRNCSVILFLILAAYLYVCCDTLAPIWIHLGVNIQNREKAFTSVLVWCKVYMTVNTEPCACWAWANLFFLMFIYITVCNLLWLKAFFT